MRYVKKTALILTFLIGSVQLSAQNLNDLSFGEDNTFEVMTWNIEYFPKSGQATIDSVTKIILALDVDVIALQEIDVESSFTQLLNNLPGWDGYHVWGSWPSLAIIYNTGAIEVNSIYQIYTDEDREFPRAPLVMEMKFQNQDIVIINNHLKCCGNNLINHNDPDDEEKRRYDANLLLDQFIDSNFSNVRVIVLGDMNDELTNSTDDNVFQNFIDDDTSYMFVDMSIAQGPSSNWSYPSWPSHLDHIMITNELFEEFSNDTSDIQTIRIDEYLPGGFSQMDGLISDHRPVALKIKIDTTLVFPIDTNDTTTGVPAIIHTAFTVYPNPTKGSAEFKIHETSDVTSLDIYNMSGRKIASITVLKNGQPIIWNTDGFASGVYYVRPRSEKQVFNVQKLVLVK